MVDGGHGGGLAPGEAEDGADHYHDGDHEEVEVVAAAFLFLGGNDYLCNGSQVGCMRPTFFSAKGLFSRAANERCTRTIYTDGKVFRIQMDRWFVSG